LDAFVVKAVRCLANVDRYSSTEARRASYELFDGADKVLVFFYELDSFSLCVLDSLVGLVLLA